MELSMCTTKTNSQGMELTLHGSAPFPIACYLDELYSKEVPWHWHNEWEAIVVSKGKALIKTENRNYIIEEGNGIFINSTVLHSIGNADETPSFLHSLVFHPRLIGGNTDSVFWQNYVHPLCENSLAKTILLTCDTDWQKHILNTLENTWELCQTPKSGYEFQVREQLSQCICSLAEHYPSAHSQPSEKSIRDEKRIKAMLEYIHQNYTESIKMKEIAKSSAISISECLRCFRRTIGMTPVQYLIQFRIHQAANLLRSTDLKIVDIGAQCGFQDMSYFSKTFREIYGCTPTEYRNIQ